MSKKMGRPATPDYYKKQFRFSAIEKHFQNIINELDQNEKAVAEKLLKEFKERAF